MSAAQLEPRPETDLPGHSAAGAHASGYPVPDPAQEPFALRQQVAERLASHRARRTHEPAPAPASSSAAPRPTRVRTARIAGAVAERYAQAESYRSFLAAEAERSVRQAEAVAEVATINAKAIASAQQQMLADLDHWDLPIDLAQPLAGTTSGAGKNSAETSSASYPDGHNLAGTSSFLSEVAPANYAYSVRLSDDVLRPRDTALPTRREIPDEIDPDEYSALDEEIAFRHSPLFEEAAGDPLPLTANLIEFPRQLVAPRKARPRLAEGPLREDGAAAEAQLRIFEVDPAHIAAAATAASTITDDGPEWSSILLAPQPATDYLPGDAPVFRRTVVPEVAPISRRLMAAVVDGAVVLGTLLAAWGVFVQTAAHTGVHAAVHLRWPVAAGALATSALVLGALYLVLFFRFGESTPGMRYARIALCTFSDENPARRAIRRRLLPTALSALPLGIGLLWAFVDEDTLSWHDRLSGMYQRTY